ncbi:uracil-DNA glycosylase family protein [Streptococcus sobrinus]|uniref:Uracil-DNA glycosylase family protein n=3 Tax=Streptococcus sobrinus TaxID=1310 RepID=A0ABM6W6M7_9STRE|nr:uracil-DNA glycosylase family protein [Streptococcus sobrinus]AWN18610.1 uracil-DNA glycosylase family protein [Streptococcus sobrinus]AWN21083.1 uracil-DNA glycosylase family protein [Streptococcus sobrinus]EMP69925.1 uracil-DNA glycosylase [Streptococcus sobrinus DSM 20742 = ATCC 33478]OZV23294.1 uracil-DNA glycosylase [Streptococcus sobrinus]SQG13869.1 uracil-DNA glycosylase [Streptococcus sobrinus]
MSSMQEIIEAIKADPQNEEFTKAGIEPLFTAPKTSRINIVGQAPGIRAQESRLYWNDPSGDNLRDWLGIDRDTFYNSDKIAVIPMDFYYPGKGKSGDLPPRKGFAEKWHPLILQELPDISLTLLIGNYAQHYYLQQKSSVKLTDNVKAYKDFLPDFFPLVHPSPRNNIWQKKNPWFKEEVLPDLKKLVKEILEK